jgi:beta-lactamase class A
MEAALTRPLPRLAAGALALLGASIATAGELPAKQADLLAKLRLRVQAVDARLDGVLGVCVRDLSTGATVELRPDEPFPTASSIKLAVLYELYRQAEEGRVDVAEVTRPPLPRVGGGGILQELGDRVSLTWRDLAVLMIGWSDNEATNVLARRVGLDAVNRRLDALSLPGTTNLRKTDTSSRQSDESLSNQRKKLHGIKYESIGESINLTDAK